jgi:hypothetical protein
MRTTSLLAHAFALGLVLLVSATARADGGAGVVVAGEATMQAPLASQLEGWLKTHGHDVAASPLDPDAINTLVDCFQIEDESCAVGVVNKRARTETVVFARIDVTSAADGTRDVTLTGYWFAKGRRAVTERRFCERCTELTLRNTADDLMLALSGAGLADLGGKLKLSSDPAGGHVIVDGHTVGVTPMETSLPPGNHDLSITADGHKVELRTITIKRGETLALAVHLIPGNGRHDADHDDQDQQDTVRHPRVLPPVLMGVGAAGIIAGAVMIVATKTPGPSDTKDKFYTSYRAPGIGLAIGGVVVGAAGLYLWMHWRRESSSAPAVSLGDGRGTVGWTWSF